jgi:hypothetical protein
VISLRVNGRDSNSASLHPTHACIYSARVVHQLSGSLEGE